MTPFESPVDESNLHEIARTLGYSFDEVDQILFKIERYFKNPSMLDNEENLIKAFRKVNSKEGLDAARAEVGRRINAAREIRKLKQLYAEGLKYEVHYASKLGEV